VSIELSARDRAMLDGELGEAARLAMRIVTDLAVVMEADRLIDVASAHVDGCLYHGPAGLEFAERLVAGGAAVSVPTTLNTGSLDLLHPDLVRETPERASAARRQMDLYVAMGCRATWTCAPYQLPGRPSLGQQIAWAESNAIVFANSVLGARTNRYGDFIDICAAITGRVPDAGLHREENRRAELVFRLSGISDRLLEEDVLYPVLGQVVGREAGNAVVAIEGLPPDTTEDRLKALGAAAASSGSVAMFHAVGITPEAPTLEAALGGHRASRTVEITPERLRAARDELSTTSREDLAAVSLGTPHFSLAEFEALMPLLDGIRVNRPVHLDRARRPVGGGTSGLALPRSSGRRPDRHGHVHLHRPDHASEGRPGHDELREGRLVRADERRRRGGVREPRGVRAFRGERPRVARRAPVGPWVTAGPSSPARLEGRR
jgi:hypothetical protein